MFRSDGSIYLINRRFKGGKKGNRRGISNLVAAAMLIVFIVSLGLLVTNWTQKLVGSGIEKSQVKIGTDLECQGVSVKMEVNPKNADEVIVKTNVALKGFITRFVVEGGNAFVDYANQEKEIGKFGAYIFDLTAGKVDADGSPLSVSGVKEKIEIIPRVDIGDNTIVDCETKKAKYKI